LSAIGCVIKYSTRGKPASIVGYQTLQKFDAVHPADGHDFAIGQDESFDGFGHDRLVMVRRNVVVY